MKWVAFVFTLFILAVILAADGGWLGPVRGFYGFPYGDKVGHFVLYGLLAFLLILYALSRPRTNPRRIVLTTAGVLMALIGLEEWSQSWFPTRSMDLVDLLFSYAGVVLFSFLAYRIKTRGSGKPTQITRENMR